MVFGAVKLAGLAAWTGVALVGAVGNGSPLSVVGGGNSSTYIVDLVTDIKSENGDAGVITIRVINDWAPIGAAHFRELVEVSCLCTAYCLQRHLQQVNAHHRFSVGVIMFPSFNSAIRTDSTTSLLSSELCRSL